MKRPSPPPAAYSCCACFVAGELGGGICVALRQLLRWWVRGSEKVWGRAKGYVCRRRAAVGWDAPPREIHIQDGRCRCPHLQQIRFSAYETLFEYTKSYQPIKSQSPRLSHDEQYLSHFASLQILLACSIENLLDNPSSIPGRAQKVF